MGRRTRMAISGGIACVGLLAGAPAASAAFGLSNLSATPASNSAGANTNLTLSLDVDPDTTDLRDLTIHLPPGLVGNPQATPQCTEAQLNSAASGGAGCPAAAQVGTVSNDVAVTGLGVPQTVTGKIYNVVPRQGEPARFGIVLEALPLPPPLSGLALPPTVLQSPANLRQSDFGLDTVLNDLPRQVRLLGAGAVTAEITITHVALTLSGKVGNPPRGFIRLPTSCGTHTVGFDATAYDGRTATGQASFSTDNCAALPFTPEFSARIKPGSTGSEPVELSTTISQTIDEAGLKTARVILPSDLVGNSTLFSNVCGEAAFQAGSCPQQSIVGSAVASSPLQSQALSGPVALVAPSAPGLPDLGLDLRGPLALKLKGKIGIRSDSRNFVVFDGLPDIPIADFTLTFAGGPNGLNAPKRNICDPPPPAFDTDFTAHSGANLKSSTRATIHGQCPGAGGHGQRRKPKARIKLGRLGSKHPTMKLEGKAGSETLRLVRMRMPRELKFSSGEGFDRGGSVKAGGKPLAGRSVKHTKRSLRLKSKCAVRSFAARFKGHALDAGHGLRPHERPRFKIKVRDRRGKTTKLTVRAS